MTVPCQHNSSTDHHLAVCALNLYGGAPSVGICLNHCKQYSGPMLSKNEKKSLIELAAIPPIVRWLGMDWEGVPWPKRIRFRWPVYCKPLPGCGCAARPKRWLNRIFG